MEPKVKDVMQPLTLLNGDAPVKEALILMREAGVDLVPVGTENDIEGMVTLSDVASAAAGNPGSDDMQVGDVKTPVIGMCNEDQDLNSVLSIMTQGNHPGLLVRNGEGKLIGVVGLKQVVDGLVH